MRESKTRFIFQHFDKNKVDAKNAFVLILFGVMNINFFSFIWSVKGVFVRKGPIGKGYATIKAIFPICVATNVITFFYFPITQLNAFSILGGIILAISASVFWWARITTIQRPLSLAYSGDAPEFIYQDGPYRFIRHPFYFSYISTFLGAALILQNWYSAIASLIIFILYRVTVHFEEIKIAGSDFGAKYQEYKTSTGMFFPKI